MTLVSPHPLKTGGDPRLLAEFAALRDEMQKLTHPARPDVDWSRAAQLCLSLFEQNGVELQTAVWYTLSRAQLAGVSGMAEGLTLIDALLTREWGTFWPRQAHARMELLAGLSRRLQQFLRRQMLTPTELGTLRQSVQLLDEVGEVLQRLELRQHSQLDALRDRLRGAIALLERNDAPQPTALVIEQPAVALPSLNRAEDADPRWIYVPPADVPLVDVRKLRRRAFLAGIGAALALSAALAIVVHWVSRQSPQDQLLASLAPAPALLNAETLAALQANPDQLREEETALLQQTQQQLDWLSAVSPGWSLQHGTALMQQTRVLLPHSAAAQAMATRWQQQLSEMALPPANAESWHQGMEQLQNLANRLDGLDEKRGKYLTVSELKTAVYNLQKSFNASVPLEAALSQWQDQGSPLTPAQSVQAAMQLKQLTAQYVLLDAPPDKNMPGTVNSAMP